MKNKLIILISLSFALLLIAACSRYAIYPRLPAETRNCPLFGANPARTGEIQSTIKLPLKLEWVKQPASAIGNTILVVDSMLYFGTIDGRFYALDVVNGKKRKHKKLSVETTCAYGKKHLIIARRYRKKTLYSYNLATNKYDWKIDAGDIASEPLAVGDWIYVSSLYKHIDRYRFDTGAKTWTYKTRALLHSSPALEDSVLVVGSDDGTVYALEAETGKLIWEFQAGACIYATPVIKDGKVFIGAFDSYFYALDLHTGELAWKYKTGAKIYHKAAASGKRLIFGSNDYYVYCINAETGKLNWKFKAQSIISTSPAISNNKVFIGSTDRHYYCFDLNTGEELWKYKTKGRVRTSPVIWGDYVFGASENYYIYAFKAN